MEGTVALVDEALLLFVASEDHPPDTLARLISYTSKQSLTLSFIHQVFLTLGAVVINVALVLSLKHCRCCCRKKKSNYPTAASPPAISTTSSEDAFNQFREQRGRQAFQAAGQAFELEALCRKKDAQIAQLQTSPAPLYQQPLLATNHYDCPSVSASTYTPSAHYATAGILNESYEGSELGFENPMYGKEEAVASPPGPTGGLRRSYHGYPGVRRQAPPPPDVRRQEESKRRLGAVPKSVHYRAHQV